MGSATLDSGPSKWLDGWRVGKFGPQVSPMQSFRENSIEYDSRSLNPPISYICSSKTPFSRESSSKALRRISSLEYDRYEYSYQSCGVHEESGSAELFEPSGSRILLDLLPSNPCGLNEVLSHPGLFIEENTLLLGNGMIAVTFHDDADIQKYVEKACIRFNGDGIIIIDPLNGRPVSATVTHRFLRDATAEDLSERCERSNAIHLNLYKPYLLEDHMTWIYQIGKRAKDDTSDDNSSQPGWQQILDKDLDFKPTLPILNEHQKREARPLKTEQKRNHISDTFLQDFDLPVAKRARKEHLTKILLEKTAHEWKSTANVDFRNILSGGPPKPMWTKDGKEILIVEQVNGSLEHYSTGKRLFSKQLKCILFGILADEVKRHFAESKSSLLDDVYEKGLCIGISDCEALLQKLAKLFSESPENPSETDSSSMEWFIEGLGDAFACKKQEESAPELSYTPKTEQTQSQISAFRDFDQNESNAAVLRLLSRLIVCPKENLSQSITEWIEDTCKENPTCSKCGENRTNVALYQSLLSQISDGDSSPKLLSEPPVSCSCAWMRMLHATLVMGFDDQTGADSDFSLVHAFLQRSASAAHKSSLAFGILETVLTTSIGTLLTASYAQSDDFTLPFVLFVVLNTCFAVDESLSQIGASFVGQLQAEGLPQCALIAAAFLPISNVRKSLLDAMKEVDDEMHGEHKKNIVLGSVKYPCLSDEDAE